MNAASMKRIPTLALLLMMSFLWACDGDDGAQGPPGQQGPQGEQGEQGDPAPLPDPVTAAIEQAKPESCTTCHSGVGAGGHQSFYDKYTDGTRLALSFDSLSSSDNGNGTFTVTLTYSVLKDNEPVLNGLKQGTNGLVPNFEQARFYAVTYDDTAREYLGSCGMSANFTDLSGGQYSVQDVDCAYAPELQTGVGQGAQVYGYIADGALFVHEGGAGAEIPDGSHVHLYDDVASAALAYGTADAANGAAYDSYANVSGCEKCHGTPYLKHGYRDPVVANLPDFASCKVCHYDNRSGGHEDWQYMVDDPANWATAGLDAAIVEDKYAYTANLMNDVHMAHAMEFPYPQSMSNCATCHEGKLDNVLDNSLFTAETCKSCHPVEGLGAWPEFEALDEGPYYQAHRAPPMTYLWATADAEFHTIDMTCTTCHGDPAVPTALPFNQLHTGYDINITDADGVRYDTQYFVKIDSISRDGDLLTVTFSANDPAIEPELLVSFYGWDSKNFLIPSHAPDGSLLCVDRRGNPGGCDMEYVPGTDHPLFTTDAEAPGAWTVTLDMGAYQAVDTDAIPTLIENMDVKYAEITVTPELAVTVGGVSVDVVLDAVGETFDLNGNALVANYFKGTNATVSTDKCDVCHDSLASSFHSESGRGGGGIQVCKNCHNPTYAGSHLEMASRSIDSYVHAIHSFQAFDVGDVFGRDGYDAVNALRYDHHIKHVFPNFTIRNCEACHLPGKYEVPDQTQSMPGLQSASDSPTTWYTIVDAPAGSIPGDIPQEDPSGRNIGTVAEAVTGPASRACGGCHRARFINQDEAGALASFNAHVEIFGTYVDNDPTNNAPEDPDDEILYGIIDRIMTWFE
jgi:OmcA/MtrC family decaheme c-type cytochrome